VTELEQDWPRNYFNYFTEIEEHFQRARGTSLFLLSPLDWALIESWRNSGLPLEAVLRGIDVAFEKWRAKKHRKQLVNSLAFCSQAVLAEADLLAAGTPSQPKPAPAAPFTVEELRQYLEANAAALNKAGLTALADPLSRFAAEADQHLADLEQLEQRLTALEEKMLATLAAAQSEEALFASRRELDLQLRPYRGKMTAPQLAMLEKQYMERRLLEQAGLPRLSLFYMK
jgi:hypothetical protein